MRVNTSTIILILAVMIVCEGLLGEEGKSVYVVRRDFCCDYDDLIAFRIEDEQLIFQKKVDMIDHGSGAIDIAADDESEVLFICFEKDPKSGAGGNIIEIYSSKTLEHVRTAALSGPDNITGLAFDSVNSRLLATDRNTNTLWLIDWDGETRTLETNPEYVELAGIDYACGLEINGNLLYVTWFHYTIPCVFDNDVYVYDMADNFQQQESIFMGAETVSIAYNATDDTIYGVAYWYSHLIKRILNPNETIEKDIVAGLIGIETDDDTGLVYLTTYREVEKTQGAIEVWDTSGWTQSVPTNPEPEFIYDNDNQDDVEVKHLAGLVIGGPCKTELMEVWKKDVDNPHSVEPGDYITYLISLRSKDENSHSNVYVTDTLPNEVMYYSAEGGGSYNMFSHTYTWEIGNVEGYDPNDPSDPNTYVELTVQVTNWAEPTSLIVNKVEVESDTSYVRRTEETLVACWGGNIIYVDAGRDGVTGTSWYDAYNDLQRALSRADACDEPGHEHQIWIANGTYKPGDDPVDDTFEIPDVVEVYGGFAGWGASDPNERDWKRYKTTLSGYIGEGPEGPQRNETVVTMGDYSLLDGVTVKEAGLRGIEANNVSSTITSCVIKENNQRGIYCENGDLILQWCQIKDNGYEGVYHEGSNYVLDIENCKIYGNQRDGIETYLSILEIKNSLVYDNGSGEDYYGINIGNPSYSPTIRNNTIVHNVNEGIKFTGSNEPDILNCIIYYNNDGGGQLANMYPDSVAFHCCISDCNDVNDNISSEPLFAYETEPYGYYHLSSDSPCRNKGDSAGDYTGEVDIDDDDRDGDSYVDIGADEVTCEDVSDPNDWSADGIINLAEFEIFSSAWLAEPNESSWDERCDIDKDYDIDIYDFISFTENWLWTACWHESYEEMWMMSGFGGGESMLIVEPILGVDSAQVLVPEKSLAEQIAEAEWIIEKMEEIWEDPSVQEQLDKKVWKDFIEKLYDWLGDLEDMLEVELKEKL
jgi:uncharacterized repeat protein (TIGR01451 family)